MLQPPYNHVTTRLPPLASTYISALYKELHPLRDVGREVFMLAHQVDVGPAGVRTAPEPATRTLRSGHR